MPVGGTNVSATATAERTTPSAAVMVRPVVVAAAAAAAAGTAKYQTASETSQLTAFESSKLTAAGCESCLWHLRNHRYKKIYLVMIITRQHFWSFHGWELRA